MGPIWGRQDPGGPHVAPMNFAIWELSSRESYGMSIVSMSAKTDHVLTIPDRMYILRISACLLSL